MKKILLIDDDDDEFYFLREALHDLESTYVCRHARNAQEGLDMLTSTKPELIFLDINMPGMNGFEALHLMKQRKLINDIPVILYSTAINEETAVKGLSLGAAACIQKRNSISCLAKALKEVLGQDRGAAPEVAARH